MELIPHRLSPGFTVTVFGVWLRSEVAPLPHPVLYPRNLLPEAVPKYVSGRTSYHQVRLAFHSYPHIIQELFTVHWFEPPLSLTSTSLCTWVAHLASGLLHLTGRPFQTRFPFGFTSLGLTSPDTITRRHINQKARGHFRSLFL